MSEIYWGSRARRSGRWLLNERAREHARSLGDPNWPDVVWALVDRDVPDVFAYARETAQTAQQ